MNKNPAIKQEYKLNTSRFVSSVSRQGLTGTSVDVVAYLRYCNFDNSVESM